MSLTTHVAYSDESHHNTGQYRGIGVVSLQNDVAVQLEMEIRKHINDSGLSEVKWKKLDSAKYRFGVDKIIKSCVDYAKNKLLRIDVLTWYIEDYRHKQLKRDDNKNLENMYILLLTHVIYRRWASTSVWEIFPDQNSIIDWKYVQNVLNNPKKYKSRDNVQTEFGWTGPKYQQKIIKLDQIDSSITPLCQVIDLFVGMAVFSHINRNGFQSWKSVNQAKEIGQMNLFGEDIGSFSSGINEKCYILHNFLNYTKDERIFSINFGNGVGLETKNPVSPINFWLYKPHRMDDCAPLKGEVI